jgi:5-methylcytosine-specific restriction endonuclease McrA
MLHIEPHSTVLVLNSSYEPLNFTNWKRAIVLLLKEKAKVISKRVIRLVNYVHISFHKRRVETPSRAMIYKRDDNQCQYCGSRKNLTIDHVIPRCRGGKDTWDNLVACCSRCNIAKGGKLLKDTDMKLSRVPSEPLSRVSLDLQKTTVQEWKEFTFS